MRSSLGKLKTLSEKLIKQSRREVAPQLLALAQRPKQRRRASLVSRALT